MPLMLFLVNLIELCKSEPSCVITVKSQQLIHQITIIGPSFGLFLVYMIINNAIYIHIERGPSTDQPAFQSPSINGMKSATLNSPNNLEKSRRNHPGPHAGPT